MKQNSKRRCVILTIINLLFTATVSCTGCSFGTAHDMPVQYREEMRAFVKKISAYAKAQNPRFVVIPQNGQTVAWNRDTPVDENGVPLTEADTSYMDAIDGCGREDTFYGEKGAGKATSSSASAYFVCTCKKFSEKGKTVFSIDYCSSRAAIADSYAKNAAAGFIGFAAPDRNLALIPEQSGYGQEYYPYRKNGNDVTKLSDAKNFLFLLGMSSGDADGSALIEKIRATDYDAVIMDAFVDGGNVPFSRAAVESIKKKASGGARFVIAYMSIGEAEDYRWYWDERWVRGKKLAKNAPVWLDKLNPDWKGNYKVQYWNEDWQTIICGGEDSYIQKIIDAGFDGVYLDIIDAYEYFEER